MNIKFIGVVKDAKKNTLGYRLVDLDDNSVKDVPSEDIIKVLKNADIKIDGLKLKGNSITGSNGILERYPIIHNKNVAGPSPLIIVTQFIYDGEVRGYRVVDWKGRLLNLSVEDVIYYAKNRGISNGAIKKVGNLEFVSSIYGEYDKIVTKTQQEITNAIEKTIWSMEDFEKYMASNNYGYIIRRSELNDRHEIEFKCMNTKVLKYPLGVSLINNMFIQEGSSVETLILSPSIKEIAHPILSKVKGLKRVVLQQGIKSIDMSGISGKEGLGESLHELSFPISIEKLSHGLSGLAGITKLDLAHTQMTTLSYCFNMLNNLVELSFPNCLKEMYRSFRQVKSLETVKFPDELIILSSGCFMESGIKIADFSNCKRLTTFGPEVLRYCPELVEVILPDSIEEIGFNAIGNCEKLRSINIPKSLRRIEGSALSGFEIGTFTVTDKMTSIGSHVFTKDTIIEFDDSNTKVRTSLIASPGYKTVVLSDNIRKIDVYAFSENSRLYTINIPKNLERIEDGAFRLCDNLLEFNLQDASKLTYIGNTAFSKCIFTHIILPEGLEEIGDSCFQGCERLKYVVLPKSLTDIGRGAFNSIGTKLAVGTTFYVYDKSFGLKYCKRNNLRYVIINSLEDVYNIENNDRAIDKSKEAKMKLLLSTNELHRELFRPEYLNYADILFRIYNHVTGELVADAYTSKLDESKLIKFPVNSIKLIIDYINYEAALVKNSNDQDRLACIEEYTEINPATRFITLCNYITKLMPFNHTPLTKNSLLYLEKEADINFNTVYYDNCSSIISMSVKDKKEGVNNENSIVIIVTMGFNIRFVGVIDQAMNSCHHEILTKSHSLKTKPTASIADLLSIGDILQIKRYNESKYNTIGGAPLPNYIYKAVIKNLEEHLVIIGHDNLETVKTKVGTANIKVDLLCRDTSKIVTVQGKLENNFADKLRSIRVLSDILVINVQNFSSRSKETERRILANLEFSSAKKFFDHKSQGEVYLDNLKKAAGAYDKDPSYEWEVSQLLNKIDTTNLEDIPIAMTNIILDTGLFIKMRKSLNDVKKLGREAKAYSLESGRYAIVEFRLKKEVKSKKVINGIGNYVVGLVDTQESESSSQDFYLSNKGIADEIKLLLKIKELAHQTPIVDNTGFYYGGITKEYVVMQRQIFSMYKDGFEYECSLAISKSDGAVYLLGSDVSVNKMMYKILRFKTLELGLKHCCWMFNNYNNRKLAKNELADKDLRDNILQTLNDLNNSRFNSKNYGADTNSVTIIREAIMSGIPNGAYIQCNNLELFDDVAKQEV